MPAQEHPAEADEALARHERRVAGLVRGLAAADPREPPAVVRTHISTVILAGETAYKLKRPVRLPFLDFSLLSQRRFFLEEELRINRRTAPQLYLDVLPVTGPIEQPVIGGDGEPADWLLRMHRFEAEGEFAAMAHAGLLRARHVQALAEHIAAFHGGLAPLTTEPPGGLPPKDARQWTLENLDEIAAHPLRPAGCAAAEVAALRRDLDRAFDQAQGLIDRRRVQGFVRECHGDLHLGNVVLWRGEVLAFDAIEFDARLRCIDIVSDVAFTFMDLLAKGLRPLAWRFINTWAARTGDYEGLTLLRLYAAYRALVRAKVALLSRRRRAGVRHRLGTGQGPGARAVAPAAGGDHGAQRLRQIHRGARSWPTNWARCGCARMWSASACTGWPRPSARRRARPCTARRPRGAPTRAWANSPNPCWPPACRWWSTRPACAATSARPCARWRSAWAWRFRWWRAAPNPGACANASWRASRRARTRRTPRRRCWRCSSGCRNR